MRNHRAKRLVIFAAYNPNGIISDYVIYYLNALRKVTDKIIFIADNDLNDSEKEKLLGVVYKVIAKRHESYDFGSYKIGYFWALEHNILKDVDELIFVNDSCYGPIFPLEEVFDKMSERQCDFWGLIDSNEDRHHLLSFFMSFKKNVFSSITFNNFVSSFHRQSSFWDYVCIYERRFTYILEKNGFKSATYIQVSDEERCAFAMRSGNGNLTLFPVSLFNYRMPLVKIKALNGVFGNNLCESPNLLLEKIKETNTTLYNIIKKDLLNRGVKDEDKWLNAKEVIGNAKIISFDIFDTLLSRPFIRPTDLFQYLESLSGKSGFSKNRVDAERRARRLHKDKADITLEQIYQEISPKFKSLKEDELRLERSLLFPKLDAKSIYEEAVRQGKTIIAVSDMYLPKEFLENVLKEKGYTKISKVFVSNEENCCKSDGRLFERVLEVLKVKPEEIVHIGDNYEADKIAPENLGVRAYHRFSEVQTMYENPAMVKYSLFEKENQNIVSSALISMYAHHYAKKINSNPFTEFGYYLGGPFAVGYCQYIHKIAKERGNDTILFVSRDGYALHKIYQKLYPNGIPSYYIYASRKLVLRNSINYENTSYVKNVHNLYLKERFGDTSMINKNLEVYKEDMKRWAAINSLSYSNYIDSLNIKGKKIMTVDMTTKEYTSLTMLRRVFGNRIDCGMFSITYGEPYDFLFFSYSKSTWEIDDIPSLILQEELITAPEYSVVGISNGEWNYASYNPTENYRIEKYKDILKGIEEFSDDFIGMFSETNICFTYELWHKLYTSYIKFSNWGDHEILKRIYHDDLNQEEYDNLYDCCIQKKRVNQNSDNWYAKSEKRLKDIRKLAVVLIVETVLIVVLLILLAL